MVAQHALLRQKLRSILTLAIGFFLLSSIGFSEVFAATGINQTINFQGKVVNTNGTNVSDASYNMVFEIYDASAAGSQLWTETWNVGTSQVSTTDGVFRVALGTYSSMASLDFNQDNLWLKVTFNGEAMSPRIRFTSVPYAFEAKRVAGLTVTNNGGNTLNIAANKTLRVDNTITLTAPDGNTYTFGTPASGSSDTIPTLTSTSTLTNKTIGSTGLTFSGASTDIATSGSEAFTIVPGGTGAVQITSGVTSGTGTSSALSVAASSLTSGTGLNVSSAATALTGMLTNIELTSSNSNNTGTLFRVGSAATNAVTTAMITNLGTGNSFRVNDQTGDTDTTPFIIDASGNVGIGFTSPGNKLTVSGGISIGTTSPTSAYLTKTAPDGGAIFEGNVGIGTTSPTSLFSVGASSQFQVDTSGDIVKLKNLTYAWPSSHTTNGVLLNNGSGTLTWSTLGASSITADSLDFTEFQDTLDLDGSLTLNQGTGTWTQSFTGTTGPAFTLTASGAVATGNAAAFDINVSNASTTVPAVMISNAGSSYGLRVNDDGTTTDTSPFVIDASGQVGIGTTTPAAKLDVNGSLLVAAGSTINTSSAGSLGIGTATQNALTVGHSGATTTINGSGLTVGPTSWTATPTISGLITATSGLTANGALTANLTFTLGDNGDTGSVNTSDWDISTTGDLSGIGTIRADNGSRSAVAYGFSSEGGDTGMYLVSDNNLAFSNGASDTLFIRSDGAVGIGTTNPSSGGKLQVNGTIRSSDGTKGAVAYGFTSEGGDTGMYLVSDNNLAFATAATDRMLIDSNGNVGIGSTAPGSNRLYVTGGPSRFDAAMSAASSFSAPVFGYNTTALGTTAGNYSGNMALFQGSVDGNYSGLHIYNIRTASSSNWWETKTRLAHTIQTDGYAQDNAYNNNSWIDFDFGGKIMMGTSTNAPTFTMTNGYVGIGTTSPAHGLDIVSSVGQDGINISAGTYPEIVLKKSGTTKAYIGIAGNANGYATGTFADSLALRAEGSYMHLITGGANIAMTVNGTSIGIGTTSPSQLLSLSSAGSTTGTNMQLTNTSALAVGNLITQKYTFNAGTHGEYGMVETSTGSSGLSDFYWNTWNGTTYAERMRLTNAGSVGIGTTAPGRTLDVVGNWGGNTYIETRTDTTNQTSTVSTKAVSYFLQNSKASGVSSTTTTFNITGLPDTDGTFAFFSTKAANTGGDENTVAVQINGVQISSVLNSVAGTSTVTENYAVVRMNSTWRILGTGSSDAADVAEAYGTKDTTMDAGDIVTVDYSTEATNFNSDNGYSSKAFIQKTQESYDSKILGIVSSNPSLTLAEGVFTPSEHAKPLALAGRVPVKVSTSNGTIQPGDPITSSTIAGIGMKATQAGTIVGKALQSFDPAHGTGEVITCPEGTDPGIICGKIVAFVNTSWYEPVGVLTSTGDMDLSSPVSVSQDNLVQSYRFGRSTAYNLKDTATDRSAGITFSEGESGLTIDFQNSDIALIAGKKGTVSLIDGEGKKSIVFDASGSAVFAGSIQAKSIKADQIEGLNIFAQQFIQKEASSAPIISVTPTPSVPVTMLALEGLTIEKDATISANLHVGGSSLIEGVLNVIDSLTTGNLLVGKWADFMGPAIFRDAVTFHKKPVFSADTAGYAVIKKDSTRVAVIFTEPYQEKPVVNATILVNGKDNESEEEARVQEQAIYAEGYTYLISRLSTTGFAIVLNKPAKEDLYFSWTAFGIDKALTAESTAVSVQEVTPQPTKTTEVTVTPVREISIAEPATGEAALH